MFDDGKLVAMAGRRISLQGYTEISAVCTHPSSTPTRARRGYLGDGCTRDQADGNTPILHVAEHNFGAQRVYEKLGFVTADDAQLCRFASPVSLTRYAIATRSIGSSEYAYWWSAATTSNGRTFHFNRRTVLRSVTDSRLARWLTGRCHRLANVPSR